MKMPVTQLPTLEFKYKNSRAVSPSATLFGVLAKLPKYAEMIRSLDAVVRTAKPDVIINFFEPVTALYALTRCQRPPVVAVGHQFMFQHPGYVRTPQLWKQLISMRVYTWLLGARSTKLALSLYPAADLPAKRIIVGPPILRKQLFGLQPNPAGTFTLIYLLNHGYADHIIRWSDAHPQTRLHCFYDKPGAAPELNHSPALTFHRLDGEKFLQMMADCRNVVCTAGFESVSEAAWLGKPLFLVPVENHIEQEVNAIDAQQFGIGLAEKTFNLDRLAELPERLPTEKFRTWLDCAPTKFFAAVSAATGLKPGGEEN
jgi:uncharacterized protein (TIGR00661 family)